MNYFKQIEDRFESIEEDSPIQTEQFLRACSTFIAFTDLLGPVLSRAKDSVVGNIRVLRRRYECDTNKYAYMHKLILNDYSQPDGNIYLSIIWLKRAVEFTYHFLSQLITSHHTSLPQDAYYAYGLSLRPYHGFIIRGLVYMLVNIAPSKDTLIETLIQGDEGGREQLFIDIADFIRPMCASLTALNKLLEDLQLFDNTVV